MEHQFKPTAHVNCSHEFIIAVNSWIMETDNQIEDSFSRNLVYHITKIHLSSILRNLRGVASAELQVAARCSYYKNQESFGFLTAILSLLSF